MANIVVELVKDRRILLLLAIIFGALLLAYFHGLRFGIDFSGGTRIPVVLEKPVDEVTMDSMIETVKTRTRAFGLTEVRVRARGNNEIQVEVPSSDMALINNVETILQKQGVYEGVVDGKLAISGEDIFTGTIRRATADETRGADWGVDFSITQAAGNRFSQTVKGKANYPLYMFLDRPKDAIVIISRQDLLANLSESMALVSNEQLLKAVQDCLRLEGMENDSVPIYLEDNFDQYKDQLVPASNKTEAIVSNNTPQAIKNFLKARNFTLVEKTTEEMQPDYTLDQQGVPTVNKWKAVGLMSSPRLSASVTEGVPMTGYIITGSASGSGNARAATADLEAREIESVLKGGALPVRISLGSRTSIPAPLGSEFLRLSMIGAAMALLAVSLLVAVRYQTAKVILPILIIAVSELIILVAVMGSFTIDLAAMAGIIAAVGVSVDSQIVITDELLKKGERVKSRLDKAFSIVITKAFVAVIALVPLLLFSGLTEIIGFATSTILGVLLGVAISRPAYAAIVERLFADQAEA